MTRPLRASPPPLRSAPPPPAPTTDDPKDGRPTTALAGAALQARLRFLEDEMASVRRDLDKRGGELRGAIERLDQATRQTRESLEARAAALGARLDALDERADRDGTGDDVLALLRALREELTAALDTLRVETEDRHRRFQAELGALRARLETHDAANDDAANDDATNDDATNDDAANDDATNDDAALGRAEARALFTAWLAEAKAELRAELTPRPPERAEGDRAPSLTDIRGVGPASAKKLRAAGVSGPAEVAAWTDADLERLHRRTGVSVKRLRQWRDNARG